jgi:hypothetical protein
LGLVQGFFNLACLHPDFAQQTFATTCSDSNKLLNPNDEIAE